MTSVRLACLAAALMAVTACAVFIPEETAYLRSAKDQATRQQIQERLGSPQAVVKTAAGDDVWVYDVYDLEPGAQSTWYSSGSWCDQYRLRFDQGGVLREWTHDAYRHGGESMPKTCLTPDALFLQKADAVADDIRRSGR